MIFGGMVISSSSRVKLSSKMFAWFILNILTAKDKGTMLSQNFRIQLCSDAVSFHTRKFLKIFLACMLYFQSQRGGWVRKFSDQCFSFSCWTDSRRIMRFGGTLEICSIS